MSDVQHFATDSLLERDRATRVLVMVACVALATLAPTALLAKFFGDWFGAKQIGFLIGLVPSILILQYMSSRLLLQVDALHAFVTVDLLRTFLSQKTTGEEGDKKVYVVYGPGLHVTFPWESRRATYNVHLGEGSEDFTAAIQTPVGIVHIKGSMRMRPDITKLVQFLGGVAAIAADVVDLFKSFLIEEVNQGDRTLRQILASTGDLNRSLNDKFGKGTEGSKDPKVSAFEDRFGVNVGDLTVSEILPSEEVQKTLSGVTEAQIIADGGAITLGYKNAEEARADISAGKLSQEHFNQARDRFMAASENITMNLDANEYTFTLQGLDKLPSDLVSAIANLGPVLATLARQNRQNNGGGQNKRGGKHRRPNRQKKESN